MRTTRRRSRLRSSQYPGERWKPSAPAIVLALGLVAGSFLGIRGKLFDQSASLQEHYLLLVSDLYAQGAPMTSVRSRLIGVGYTNPSDSVVSMANRLGSSHDPIQQQESDQLHQFAEALAAGLDKENVVTPSAVASATTPSIAAIAVTDTPAPAATATPAPPPTAPAVAPAPAATATPVPAAPPSTNPPVNQPPPTAVPATLPNPGPGKGVVKTNDRKPATLRKDPTAKSIAIAALPYGTVVQIVGATKGEAAVVGDPYWYKVQVNNHVGYVYDELIQKGG